MANAINKAVTMDPVEREGNYGKLLKYVEKFTAAHWVRWHRPFLYDIAVA